jgi:hypothetical protein
VPAPVRRRSSARSVGLAKGFRSGLEDVVAQQITSKGLDPQFESIRIEYVKPERKAKYTPDFPAIPKRDGSNIIIETKGRFETEDRQKHLLIKAQHPSLDIRFVFSRSKSVIRKGSPTTYADWCRKNGFLFADKLIPEDWFTE